MSLNIKKLLPKITDRAVFIGQTGSGKSTLARYLLRYRVFVWVLDVNDALDWHKPSPEYPEGEYLACYSLEDLVDKQAYPKLILKFPIEDQDNVDLFNQFFKLAYHAGNVTVYVDEVYAVTNRQVIPPYYKALLTRGRIKGIEVWSATQRPSSIPSFILSESENVYVFKLRYPPDLKRIEELTQFDKTYIQNMPKRMFCYSNGETSFYKLQLNLNK